MHNLKINNYLRIILLISLISIISAFFIEHVLGHQPCNLCLIQRVPYILSIFLIIVNYFLGKNEQFIILLLIFTFSFSLIISFYHFGIEQGIFKESPICGINNASNTISKEELLKQLQAKPISCKDVTFKFFGFSLTTFNMMISLIIVILLIKIFKNYEYFKK